MKKTAEPGPGIILPPSLAKGDTIGLVAPAGPVKEQDAFLAGIRLLKEMGFEVKFNRDLLEVSEGYLAAADEVRLAEFNRMWADDEVKALLCVRGGYGSLRMVDLLDMELIRQRPKMLIGYSDISVLLNVIFKETGLITFHGPVLTSLARCERRALDIFLATLFGKPVGALKPEGLEILRSGNASGCLVGGNLTTLVHLIGTVYEPVWDRIILVLEDVGEAPYRIDRMLTQLRRSGRFDRLRGLILGTFSAEPFAKYDEFDYESVWNRGLELVGDLGVPIWANFPVGHTARNTILPLGIEAEMDSAAGMLKFLGPCTC
jgi:muramoyltetrapeptide carboxypeptidase